jgi:hypothetical protein
VGRSDMRVAPCARTPTGYSPPSLPSCAFRRLPACPLVLCLLVPQLDANDPVETLKAVLEAETGMPAAQQCLLREGKELPAGGYVAGGARVVV